MSQTGFFRLRKTESRGIQADNSRVEDASIVATHMVPAAQNEGVDSCRINFFEPEKAAKEFGLLENEEVLMILDLGYAEEGTGPLASHTERKPLSETVSGSASLTVDALR